MPVSPQIDRTKVRLRKQVLEECGAVAGLADTQRGRHLQAVFVARDGVTSLARSTAGRAGCGKAAGHAAGKEHSGAGREAGQRGVSVAATCSLPACPPCRLSAPLSSAAPTSRPPRNEASQLSDCLGFSQSQQHLRPGQTPVQET